MSWLEDVRRAEIIAPVHARSDRQNNEQLGLSFEEVREHVIAHGQADFCSPYVSRLRPSIVITQDDRALLYAYNNQPGHLAELQEAFTDLFGALFPDGMVVLDLGCGPATVALALGAVVGPQRFRYVGVDRAPPMLRLASHLVSAARGQGAWNATTTFEFLGDLGELPVAKTSWDPILVVTSFLHASPTLDSPVLAKSVIAALERIGGGDVTLLYLNAIGTSANSSWPAFEAVLCGAGFENRASGKATIRAPRQRNVTYALLHRARRTKFTFTKEIPR